MTDAGDLDLSFGLDTMFPEPPRPPTPPPTISTYTRRNGQEIRIRLVGTHPLWGHYLWNSARCLGDYLDDTVEVKGKTILELGAGGALPSIIAGMNGAKKVVVTDYPDRELVENMSWNLREAGLDIDVHRVVEVMGYIWGSDVKPLRDQVTEGFDIIILSDLIFNHSQHDALLKTCELAGKDGVEVLVFYTHHRPHLAHRDMGFFEKAKQRGWGCEMVVERRYEPMFPNDPGAEDVRGTVYGWSLTRSRR
ncbi:hypothetical protein D9758_013459 [Tetrapyrgos nigripes]|uniref:Protein N-terminal and lysine N-methyltransferase EFM7 n=1 Tax=Tetrapyrgos nigripes TaxID=182062 RepID=A0A8H5CRK8_9AGAR|nr:hypothetical protein D9758_013459 [Tetrapyrgos nigripes]